MYIYFHPTQSIFRKQRFSLHVGQNKMKTPYLKLTISKTLHVSIKCDRDLIGRHVDTQITHGYEKYTRFKVMLKPLSDQEGPGSNQDLPLFDLKVYCRSMRMRAEENRQTPVWKSYAICACLNKRHGRHGFYMCCPQVLWANIKVQKHLLCELWSV